ncbi:nickel pincer cofactor biosynthesis protein LarB [Novipirellula sp.]|uniref:nickel pincer cofactor biosynthesis protein LarB n=1 Tax=Novipirellula sp. TaxID=2795430 RepID=UPI00356AC540
MPHDSSQLSQSDRPALPQPPSPAASISPEIAALIAGVAAGSTSVAEAISALQIAKIGSAQNAHFGSEAEKTAVIDGATVDLGRRRRCGFGEVIYGEGKDFELIARIIDSQIADVQTSLVTRVHPEIAEKLKLRFPHSHHHALGRTFRTHLATEAPCPAPIDPNERSFHVAVVTAGSTDAAVAAEAIETLTWMGVAVRVFTDIGVAGPQRLIHALPELRKASAAIVIAGMEGALPPVVAGHLSIPIFAVPTSVGYGATLGGLTPLLGMLSSCAANVAVVNIDAGFKGGYLAGTIIRQLEYAQEHSLHNETSPHKESP